MNKLKVLDLFSGIGGFSLGLERTGGFETAAFCEIDPFCKKVLKKHWPDVPIYEDVRSLNYGGSIDVICGGFPCQPFSVAGKREGAEDDRHLWPAMFGLIQKYRPGWVIGENVAGLVNMGLDNVLTDLESEGYTTRTFVIPACAVNAPHRRDRVWIIANAQSDGGGASNETGRATGGQNGEQTQQPTEHGEIQPMANTDRTGREEQHTSSQPKGKGLCAGSVNQGGGIWAVEPGVGRVANGIPARMDRLKSLGNAVVPQIPEIIGNAILSAECVQ